MIRFYPRPVTFTDKPFKKLGPIAGLINGGKALWDTNQTWQDACKSTGQKVAKTAIIAGGLAASYGVGLAVASVTGSWGLGAYLAGSGVAAYLNAGISWGQDQLYSYFGL
jgi:hypothetical protein